MLRVIPIALLMSLMPFASLAETPEEERARLIELMTPQQRMMFEHLPPAHQERALEAVRQKQRKAERPPASDRIGILPPALQNVVNGVIADRSREATERVSEQMQEVEREDLSQHAETCRQYRSSERYDDELDQLCDRYDEQGEMRTGLRELGDTCAMYEDEERENMCRHYQEQLASAPGSDEQGAVADTPASAQIATSIQGMRMMYQACGCDELDLEDLDELGDLDDLE